MMSRALAAAALLVAAAGLVQAQSLAEVARAEEARRKAIQAPAKVYTNADLRPDFTKPTPPAPPPGAAPAAGAPGDAAPVAGEPEPAAAAPSPAAQAEQGQVRDQAYWQGRITEARARLERSRSFAQALQNRIDMLWTDFVNRGDPVQQRAIDQEHKKALAELDVIRKEIEDNTRAVAAIEEEARRAGVPPGWLRPS